MAKKGEIVTKGLQINDKKGVEDLFGCIIETTNKARILDLMVEEYYFKFSEDEYQLDDLETPGWYVIFDRDYGILYVGSAENLNRRLNTKNGSRDNFANPQRKFDPERNFIKKFVTLGVVHHLKVACITEENFLEISKINGPLSQMDRKNIEKIIRIFSAYIFHKSLKIH